MVTKVEVFGTGCANCKQVEENARKAGVKLGIDLEVVKVDDFETFIRRGITATPGMAINGEIVSLGRVPPVDEIVEMLTSSGEKKKLNVPEINVINPTCGCETKGTMIFPCSGGSNVGQMSNEVAKLLVDHGVGKFSCLAGIGAHKEGFISSAKAAGTVVAIDGCVTRCASRTLEHAGIGPLVSFVITDMDIKKDTTELVPDPRDVSRVLDHIKSKI